MIPMPGREEPFPIGVFTSLELTVCGMRDPQEWPSQEAFAAAATSLHARGLAEIGPEGVRPAGALSTVEEVVRGADGMLVATTTDGLVITALHDTGTRALLVESVAEDVHTFVLAPADWLLELIGRAVDVPPRQPPPDGPPPAELDGATVLELFKRRSESELLVDTVTVLSHRQDAWTATITDVDQPPTVEPASGAEIARLVRRLVRTLGATTTQSDERPSR